MVLRKDYANMFICPNERFVKTDYILNNPNKYDSYLFGSSRVSQMPIALLNKGTGHKWYNMTYISGVMSDHVKILNIFIKNKVPIKNLIIGLDFWSFKAVPPENHTRVIMYPDTWKEKFDFYFTYIFLEPDSDMLKEVRFNGKDALYDVTGTGEYHFLKKEKLFEQNKAEHAQKFKFPIPMVCTTRIKKSFAELKEIITLCKENNIKLTFFFNPGNINLYLCDDINFVNQVRTRFAQMADYWDFSGPNSITTDTNNYIDLIHHRKNVGALMINRMLNTKETVPGDFGVLVTKENVGVYTKKAVREFQVYKKKIAHTCIPCKK